MISRKRQKIEMVLIGLAVIFAVAGWRCDAKDTEDDSGIGFFDNIEGIGAEMKIIMSIVQSVSKDCTGMDPFDSTVVNPDLRVGMSSWELRAVGNGGQREAAPVTEKFDRSEMTFGADSSAWTAGMLTEREDGFAEGDYTGTDSFELQDNLGTCYKKIYFRRDTRLSKLGKLFAEDSSVSITTSPIEIDITESGEVEKHYECGMYIAYFHTIGFVVVQDSIVNVKDSE